MLPDVIVTPGTARPVGQALILATCVKKSLLKDPKPGRALLLPDTEVLHKGTEQQALKALVALSRR